MQRGVDRVCDDEDQNADCGIGEIKTHVAGLTERDEVEEGVASKEKD